MSNEVMSPEEIERMLSGAGEIEDTGSADAGAEQAQEEAPPMEEPQAEMQPAVVVEEPPAHGEGKAEVQPLDVSDFLSKDEQDVLGEVGNICMGTSATTMSTLLDRRVIITTPKISIHTLETLSDEYPAPLVVAEVSYTKGLFGDNLLILREYDVALITNTLLGETEEIDPDNIDLNEIHMSAMNEVMNQMVGSSATSMADIFGKTIDISTPTSKRLKMDEGNISDVFSKRNEPFVKISFAMEIENLLTSEIMQIIPIEMAHQMAREVLGDQPLEAMATPAPQPVEAASQPVAATQPMAAAPPQQAPIQEQPMDQQMPQEQFQQQPPAYQQQPAYQQPPMYQQQPMYQPPPQQPMYQNVQQPSFPSFSTGEPGSMSSAENIEMILDVPMRVTVELGKARQKIKNILDYNMGSVIVLDKIAGEAVDILVNGKRIGRGEVVVIDDNYGVRITEINSFSAQELL